MDEKLDEQQLVDAANLIFQSIYDYQIGEGGYPSKTDKLFVADAEHWHMNACINYHSDDLMSYVEGYLIAAKILTNLVYLTRAYLDLLIYPIIFLYRHFLELILKGIIIKGYGSFDDIIINERVKKTLNSHDLLKLYECFEPIAKRVFTTESNVDDVLSGIKSHLAQINHFDQNSTAFRYSRDKNNSQVNLTLTHLNLRSFVVNIHRTIEILEGCVMLLDNLGSD